MINWSLGTVVTNSAFSPADFVGTLAPRRWGDPCVLPANWVTPPRVLPVGGVTPCVQGCREHPGGP